MASYGQLINSGFDPVKESVYTLFTEYFENPVMTKIGDVNNFSKYLTKIHALLGVEFRYIIVFVRKNNAKPGSQLSLDRLKWVSLQTRTLSDEHDLSWHAYIPRRLPDLDKKITLVNKDERQYVYTVQDLPLIVTLLPKSKGLDYNSSGTVVSALETYQTIITFT